MSTQTSNQVRTVVTVMVVIAAILMIVVVPLVTNSMINPIVQSQLASMQQQMSEGTPEAAMQAAMVRPAPWVISFALPLWATLTFVAGLALLVITRDFYNGKPWTRGVALLCFSMPAIGGGFMLPPWINAVVSRQGGFPLPVLVMAIGLIPYFTILLVEKGNLLHKAVDFAVFLMLGVTAAESFANTGAAFRVLYGHPKRPMIPDDIAVLWLATLGLLLGGVLVTAAIYLLGNRRLSGWYVGMIGGLAALGAGGVTHYFRHSTNDYLYNSLMGLSVVVLLLIPVAKKRLLEEPQTTWAGHAAK